jgi:hypothetical protein
MGWKWVPQKYGERHLPLLNMNQVPEKLYLGQWLYKKKLSNQCCLTAEIEPVQDKMNIFVYENSTKNYK